MPRHAGRPPTDFALPAAAGGCGLVAVALSAAGADFFPVVRVLLLLAAGLLGLWHVRRLGRAERRASAGWRSALGRQVNLEQQLAALRPSPPESPASPGWDGGGPAVATRTRQPVALLAAVAVAGLVYDYRPATGRVRRRGLRRLLGYRPGEVPPTAAGWHALVHPDDRVRLATPGASLVPGRRRLEAGYRVRHADGTWRHVRDRAVLVWRAGRLVRVVGCTTDITAEVDRADGLRAADRRKDDLLAQIAHELRNPLAPIRTAADAVRAVPGLPPVVAGAADIIHRQAHRLGRLVDDLLDVTRISRGQVRLAPERIDLRDVLREAVEAGRPALDARRHTLTVELPADPLPMDADPGRLTQVFSNLLTNAAKYTPDGGRVTLAAAAEAGKAVVRVADTGLGLPADQLARIFDPFTQLPAGLNRSAGGLGIGLALVRSLVELHAGAVAAASDGPGRGSTFTVRLPLRPTAELGFRNAELKPATGLPIPHSEIRVPQSRRVLVVDDHPDAADSLAGLLKLLGHTPAVAHDGPGGLAAVRAVKPDVVLLDLTLPGMSGELVATAVRADRDLDGVRLVAVSGHDGPPPAGFSERLSKPVGVADLQRVLAGG